MATKILFMAPLFDEVTEYSLRWARAARNSLVGDLDITFLEDSDAKRTQYQQHNTPDLKWFVHYDHGSDYVMWGDDELPIIDLGNLDSLAGKKVYCMNCSSGKGLGAHSIELGIDEYLGYNDVVSFIPEDEEAFMDVFNYGIWAAVNNNLNLRDIVEEMRTYGYDRAEELRAEGKTFSAACLVHDMDILHVYYPGSEPPAPECPISSLIQRIFGWRGLRLARRLRQIIRPEKHL